MGPVRLERTTSRLSAGCTTDYATGPVMLPNKLSVSHYYMFCIDSVIENPRRSIRESEKSLQLEDHLGMAGHFRNEIEFLIERSPLIRCRQFQIGEIKLFALLDYPI